MKTAVKLDIDHMMRNRNFKTRNDVVEKGSFTKSNQRNKACVEKTWRSVFSGKDTDNDPEETNEVSVMTYKPPETEVVVRDEKDDRLLPHPIRSKEKQTDKKKATKRRIKTGEVRLCADTNIVKKTSCKFWHLSVSKLQV